MLLSLDEFFAFLVGSDVLVVKVIEPAESVVERKDEEVRVVRENRGGEIVGERRHRLVRFEVRHAVEDRRVVKQTDR